MNKLVKFFLNKEFLVFVVIGVINTFNGTIFSYVYSNFMNENIAFIFGYISGLIISYFLNSFITFKERLGLQKFIKFAISYIPNFIIQNVVVILMFNIMEFHKIIAYGFAAIIGVPVTFFFMKIFAFKSNDSKI